MKGTENTLLWDDSPDRDEVGFVYSFIITRICPHVSAKLRVDTGIVAHQGVYDEQWRSLVKWCQQHVQLKTRFFVYIYSRNIIIKVFNISSEI